MSVDETASGTRAMELRQAFDRSFAEPPRTGTEEALALLTLHVGGDAYAVKLAEITGLVADRRIVSLPSAAPAFIGVTGLRGSTVPVWSLAALLGYGTAPGAPRWLVLVADGGNRQALGLAFEHFDGHLRVPRVASSERPLAAQDGTVRPYIGGSVRIGDVQRGVLTISSIVDAIKQRLGLERRHEGQMEGGRDVDVR